MTAPCEQDPRLLEALPDRGDEPRETPAIHAQAGRRSGVVEPVAHRLELVGMIGLIDLAAREDVLAPSERCRPGALQDEHLEPLVAVAEEHHGGGRPDRDRRGWNSVVVHAATVVARADTVEA